MILINNIIIPSVVAAVIEGTCLGLREAKPTSLLKSYLVTYTAIEAGREIAQWLKGNSSINRNLFIMTLQEFLFGVFTASWTDRKVDSINHGLITVLPNLLDLVIQKYLPANFTSSG